MTVVVIDQSRCVGCGLCARDCRAKALDIVNKKARHNNDCMLCGHCAAICPENAVSIPSYDMADVEPVCAAVSPDDYLRLLKSRRSVRAFTDQKLDEAVLARVLEAGRYSPTAVNRQDCVFHVYQRELPDLKAKFWQAMPEIIDSVRTQSESCADTFREALSAREQGEAEDMFFYDAPCLLVISSYNPVDAALAAAHIDAMAAAMGLGALFEGYLLTALQNCPPLLSLFTPEGRQPVCCMLLGYPAVRYRRTAPRKPAAVVLR